MATIWTYGTDVDMTNGGADDQTAVTILSGLSSVTHVMIMMLNVSTDAANQAPAIQLGDSGGFEATGYLYTSSYTSTEQAYTTMFPLGPNAGSDAADASTALWELWLHNGNEWHCRLHGQEDTKASVRIGYGTKTLTTELTQIQITTTGGTAQFDGGTAIGRYK